MFRYCPACASENIRFEETRVFRCPDCGLTYYHNTAAATGCIILSDTGILFLVRNKDPGKGMLDLPGGFIDPGEGAMEGLRRECIEELGLDFNAEDFKLFASFPNKYPYKNIVYNTCDLFFFLNAPDLTEKDVKPEQAEISGVQFIKINELDIERIAFESVKKAVKVFLKITN